MEIRKDKQYNISSSKFKLLSSTSGVGSVVTTKWGGFIMPLSINEWEFVRILRESIKDKKHSNYENKDHQDETGVEIVEDERFIKFLQAKKGFEHLKCFAAIPHVSLSLSNYINIIEHPMVKEQKLKGRTLSEELFYIPAIDFPKWFVSAKSELKSIDEWFKEWQHNKCNDGKAEYFAPPRDPQGRTKHKFRFKDKSEELKDPYVYKTLTPVPLVLICPNGHISDIPWHQYFCAKLDGKRLDDKKGFDLFGYSCDDHCKGKDHKGPRGMHKLKWIVNRNQSESWGSLYCEECGERVSLTGIMNIKPLCKGEKPWEPAPGQAWVPTREDCKTNGLRSIMQVAMVTSNSIYYAFSQSSLYVPINWTSHNRIQLQGDASDMLQAINKKYLRMSVGSPDLTKEAFLSFDLVEFAKSESYNVTEEECNAIKNEFLGISNEVDIVKTYRLEEYNVFVNYDMTPSQDIKFEFNDIDLEQMGDQRLSSKFLKIKQVPMLAITNTQLGFSRVKMPSPKLEKGHVVYPSNEIRPIYSGNIKEVYVLPANQIYGEGLFFAFDDDSIREWAENHYRVNDVDMDLNEYYATRLDRGSMGEFLSSEMDLYGRAKFYLLHTFSHLIMKELEFSCGYPTASLSERLYYSNEMCGVLIYTADGAEGSMGGLVWQGQPKLIEKIILSALDRAQECSSDPLCWENKDGLNKAACFSCAMVSETSCEHGNTGLDRRALVDPIFGFFKDLL